MYVRVLVCPKIEISCFSLFDFSLVAWLELGVYGGGLVKRVGVFSVRIHSMSASWMRWRPSGKGLMFIGKLHEFSNMMWSTLNLCKKFDDVMK